MLWWNDSKPLNILITGATHGLGKNALNYLINNHVIVRATGRDLTEGNIISNQGIEFIPQDLTNLTKTSAQSLLSAIDVVWHCAALSSPWGAYNDFYRINVDATTLLANAAKNSGVKAFIHISTPSIYFNYQNHLMIKEEYRPEKYVNHYAKTKMIAEEKLYEINQNCNNFNLLFLRPRAIFGPYDRVLFPRIFNLLKHKKNILPLPRNGQALLDVTYVKNVVHAMTLATQQLLNTPALVSGEAYNISNDSPIILKKLLEQIITAGLAQEFSIKSPPYYVLNMIAKAAEYLSIITQKEPRFTTYSIGALNFDMTLDISKAQSHLNYQPIYSLQTGIDETLAWLTNGNY